MNKILLTEICRNLQVTKLKLVKVGIKEKFLLSKLLVRVKS